MGQHQSTGVSVFSCSNTKFHIQIYISLMVNWVIIAAVAGAAAVCMPVWDR